MVKKFITDLKKISIISIRLHTVILKKIKKPIKTSLSMKKGLTRYLPSASSTPKMMADEEAARMLWTRDWPLHAGTTSV